MTDFIIGIGPPIGTVKYIEFPYHLVTPIKEGDVIAVRQNGPEFCALFNGEQIAVWDDSTGEWIAGNGRDAL